MRVQHLFIFFSLIFALVALLASSSTHHLIFSQEQQQELEMSSSNDQQQQQQTQQQDSSSSTLISSLADFAKKTSYSLLENLRPDPEYKQHRPNRAPRQVRSGHFVPVEPTGISNPIYVAHSSTFFSELGIDQNLAQDADFMKAFSGNFDALRKEGKLSPEMDGDKVWATGYALSIMGKEYYSQCPFQTGNGYGDGRACSIAEAVFPAANYKRYEFQLKGGGRTPYCRGGDGRAVLRSSIREFLAQEAMHALGVPTSRSFTLYASRDETVERPWYSEKTDREEPDRIFDDPVAISTRVAPSFIRVGQLELFGRRARKNEHPEALKELEMIVQHAIRREYQGEIELPLDTSEVAGNSNINKYYLQFAERFRDRQTSLVANWMRVGFVQGNFNADNNAVGGYTLDYGPFGWMNNYQRNMQQWTGGEFHYSFSNQMNAAHQNFKMFCVALMPLLKGDEESLAKLNSLNEGFAATGDQKIKEMYAKKMGLKSPNPQLFAEMEKLMEQTPVDYTIFFRELSNIPKTVDEIKKSFYTGPRQLVFSSLLNGNGAGLHPTYETDPETIVSRWAEWLGKWNAELNKEGRDPSQVSAEMKKTNPKFIFREWLVVDAYKQAMNGLSNFSLTRELQRVLLNPYDEQSKEVEEKFYVMKPLDQFNRGGVSHCSCSS